MSTYSMQGVWKFEHCLRYHMYFTPEMVDLPDSISFSYRWSMGVEVEYTGGDGSGGVEAIQDSGTGDDDIEG